MHMKALVRLWYDLHTQQMVFESEIYLRKLNKNQLYHPIDTE